MRKKRFYNNKRRGKKWTEKPSGRKLYFADKYASDLNGESNTDGNVKYRKPFFTRERLEGFLRLAVIIACSVVLVGTGYTIMELHLERNAMPINENKTPQVADLYEVNINLKATECRSMSLDNGVMLSAVIDNSFDGGYSSLAFELKRSDGTIGYTSQLATVNANGAVSSPSSDLAGSVRMLKNNDLLPIGIISCYKDNIMANADISTAIMKSGKLYKDAGDNAYLDPSSTGTYNYIRSIVEESVSMGISVFVLDDYDLPDDIKNNYYDGFDTISTKLYNDFNDIKLYRAVHINLKATDKQSLDEEFKKKTKDMMKDKDIAFCITTKDEAMLKQYLDNRRITNYIICE